MGNARDAFDQEERRSQRREGRGRSREEYREQSVSRQTVAANDVADGVRGSGKIKRIVRDKGFGFIIDATTGQELFFHRSQVEDFDGLEEGQLVSFQAMKSPKGPRAHAVTPA